MIYHMIAFGLGFCLDLLLGDPYWVPHPIRVIGNFIGILEKRMNKKECSEKYLVRAGIGMIALVLLTVLMVTGWRSFCFWASRVLISSCFLEIFASISAIRSSVLRAAIQGTSFLFDVIIIKYKLNPVNRILSYRRLSRLDFVATRRYGMNIQNQGGNENGTN